MFVKGIFATFVIAMVTGNPVFDKETMYLLILQCLRYCLGFQNFKMYLFHFLTALVSVSSRYFWTGIRVFFFSVSTSKSLDTEVWSENLKRRDFSEDLGAYGKIILERFLGK
jgi:hypothetical protein